MVELVDFHGVGLGVAEAWILVKRGFLAARLVSLLFLSLDLFEKLSEDRKEALFRIAEVLETPRVHVLFGIDAAEARFQQVLVVLLILNVWIRNRNQPLPDRIWVLWLSYQVLSFTSLRVS